MPEFKPWILEYILKNITIEIYKTIILPVVLYGCDTRSLALKEDHRLMLLENRVLRRIFGPKGEEVREEWKNHIIRSLMICTPHPILLA
jgi:hypothetical protein